MSHVPPRRPYARVVTDATGHTTYRFSVSAHPAAPAPPMTPRVADTAAPLRPAVPPRIAAAPRAHRPSVAERRHAAELRRISRGSGCSLSGHQDTSAATRWAEFKATFARLSRPAR